MFFTDERKVVISFKASVKTLFMCWYVHKMPYNSFSIGTSHLQIRRQFQTFHSNQWLLRNTFSITNGKYMLKSQFPWTFLNWLRKQKWLMTLFIQRNEYNKKNIFDVVSNQLCKCYSGKLFCHFKWFPELNEWIDSLFKGKQERNDARLTRNIWKARKLP